MRKLLFDKVLIANRGEIACRVMRTCNRLGIRTVAVYSDADAHAQHVIQADEAYNIGPAAASASYLNITNILDVCKRTGVQAVHPGYGFLSENASFSKACKSNGISFIGPPESAIIAMGSKSESKRIMIDAKVPCTPGYHGEDQSMERLKAAAGEIGYPVMLKAVMGGGGKGMRVAKNEGEIEEMIDSCKREAKSSFGDERILIEKFLVGPRHVELQVFADTHGNCVHLFERDCSVQRRHQKVLEEAPAPFLSPELRSSMGQAAINAAKAVGYVGAGTVEFMLDPNTGNYYFMEMNTRLQVEHPVTEMITGLDLVELQVRVAAGEPLPFKQEDLSFSGHALEARIYAENPAAGFLPGSGKLSYLKTPNVSDNVRVDTGVVEGDTVSVHYDPMISKLIVHGKDRDEALSLMKKALGDYRIGGLWSNISFVNKCITNEQFIKGGVSTKFIEENEKDLLRFTPDEISGKRAIAAVELVNTLRNATYASGFRVTGSFEISKDIEFSGSDSGDMQSLSITVQILHGSSISVDGLKISGKVLAENKYAIEFENGEKRVVEIVEVSKAEFYVYGGVSDYAEGNNVVYKVKEAVPDYEAAAAGGTGKIVSPMPGKIIKVLVKPGDKVEKGKTVVVMEAMKMEHAMKAGIDGEVKSVDVRVDDFVGDSQTLCTIE